MRTPTPWILPTQPVVRADLLASGVTPRMVRTRLGSGDLVQVRRGVYLRTDAWPADAAGQHVVSARAELTVHTSAVASHQSAALILGLPTPGFGHWEDRPVSVTLPVTGNSTSSATAIHHTGPLPPGQVQRDKEGYLVNPSRESVAESLSAGHMQLSGFPTPRFQAEIRTPIGTLYPDFFWEDLKLIGECDGAVKYNDASGYVLEKEREQVLRDLGYRFVRWLAKEIMLRPAVVMERIARALAW